MFLFLFIVVIISFSVYMYLNDGFIYISSKHFEKEISVKKIKKKLETKKNEGPPRCPNCNAILEEGQKLCSKCINKELEIYSSSNTLKK